MEGNNWVQNLKPGQTKKLIQLITPAFVEMIGGYGLQIMKERVYGKFYIDGKRYFYRAHLRTLIHPKPIVETTVYANFQNVRETEYDMMLISFSPLTADFTSLEVQSILMKYWMDKWKTENWETSENKPNNTQFQNSQTGVKTFKMEKTATFRKPPDFEGKMKISQQGNLISETNYWHPFQAQTKNLLEGLFDD